MTWLAWLLLCGPTTLAVSAWALMMWWLARVDRPGTDWVDTALAWLTQFARRDRHRPGRRRTSAAELVRRCEMTQVISEFPRHALRLGGADERYAAELRDMVRYLRPGVVNHA